MVRIHHLPPSFSPEEIYTIFSLENWPKTKASASLEQSNRESPYYTVAPQIITSDVVSDDGTRRRKLDAEHGSIKYILVVGFPKDDEWELQRQWFRSGLKIPLRFIPNWRGQVPTGLTITRRPWKPDLILFEAQDPGGLGVDLLRYVRTQPALREVIMVACAEDCSDENVKRAYSLGADCCVRKSNGFAEVLQLLRKVEAYWFGHPPFGQKAA